MKYLLDTNTWAQYLNVRVAAVPQKIAATPPEEIRLCAVVKAELYFGAHKGSRKADNLALLANLFRRFKSLDFDNGSAEVYGRIKLHLLSRGTPIGPNDMMIAAIALSNDLTLVTHNTSEFSRVPHLKLEDWELTP